MIDAPALDTWLARLLLERGRLDVNQLQDALAQVRQQRATGGPTLARSLVVRGILPEQEALAYLRQVAPSGGGPELQGWRMGAQVDGYTLRERLGAGGMGAVYLAEHQATGARYAIKTLPADADDDLRERFRREAQAQAAVDAHPNVVRVHSAGEACGRLYLVMDLARGGDLQQRLRSGLPPPAEGAVLVASLARGLQHAHDHGVLHRDLKPANVMFDEAGVPKLVDFGLARVSWESRALTKTGDLMGTPAYMAPEQAQGRVHEIDARTDVYGLGAILYEVLTGRPPFEAGSVLKLLMEVTEAPPRRPRALNPAVTPAIERVCLEALAKDPRDRPRSAGALADQLEAALEEREAPPTRSLPVALLGGVALAAGVAIAVFVFRGFRSVSAPPAEEPPVAAVASPAPTEPRALEEPKSKPRSKPERPSRFPAGPHRFNPDWIGCDSEAPLPPVAFPYERLLQGPYEGLPEERRGLFERARGGNDDAIVRFAQWLRSGRCDLPDNRRLALAWFLEARRLKRLEGTAGAADVFYRAESLRSYRQAARLYVEIARDREVRQTIQNQARWRLADMLRRGKGSLHKDLVRALGWLEAICHEGGGDAKAWLRYASLLLDRDDPRDYERARLLLEKVKRSGADSLVREAKIRLAEIHRFGKHVPVNEELAERLLVEAAYDRDGKPRFRLAMLRLGGLTRDRGDLTKARQWFSLAADPVNGASGKQFLDDAEFALYHLYLDDQLNDMSGGGLAWGHLANAKNLKHPRAMELYAHEQRWTEDLKNPSWSSANAKDELPLDGLRPFFDEPLGPYEDEGEAIRLRRERFEEKEDPELATQIGLRLLRRSSVPRHRERGVRWLLEARRLGLQRATYRLGALFRQTRLWSRADPKLALALLVEAGREGYVPACILAAELLHSGSEDVLQPDGVRALRWLEEACQLAPDDPKPAARRAALLIERGDEGDLATARSLLERFVDHEDGGEACARLGDVALAEGNRVEAERLYRLSAEGLRRSSFTRSEHALGMLRLAQLWRERRDEASTAAAGNLLLRSLDEEPDWVTPLAHYELWLMHEAGEVGAQGCGLSQAHLNEAAEELPQAARALEELRAKGE